MKRSNHLSNGYRLMTLVLTMLLIFFGGCTKDASDPTGDDLNDMNMKSLVMNEGTVSLQGFMRWYVYAKMEHKLIVDPQQMITLCEAELTFTNGHNFTLNTVETIPMDPPVLFREMTIKGKITPGGVVMYTWPETWLELNWATMTLEPAPYADLVTQVGAHTGYELSGPGVNKGTVNYNGFFDGTSFYADCHTNAFQLVPGPEGTPYAELVAGPIIFSMITELHVVN